MNAFNQLANGHINHYKTLYFNRLLNSYFYQYLTVILIITVLK